MWAVCTGRARWTYRGRAVIDATRGHYDTEQDNRLMDRAFELAERARGRVSPNPLVGCVIATAGQIVGEGWTQPPGQAHAERVALQQAGPRARGATAYVTLEPCNHTGRTPPCTQALLDAGVSRVVAALRDPNPIAAGGAEWLRQAGVIVDTDAAVERARRQNEVFLHGLAAQRPFVIAKIASSIDGFIADHTGASHWITGQAARRQGHRLRAEVDAVLVGSSTALTDDPRLTVRRDDYDGPQPLRVVLDRRGRVSGQPLQMFTDGGDTVVLDSPDPGAALARLWERGVRSVLVEGGAGIIGGFLTVGMIDRFEIHLGGVILGRGLSGVAGAFALDQAPRLRLVDAQRSDDDLIVTAYPKR